MSLQLSSAEGLQWRRLGRMIVVGTVFIATSAVANGLQQLKPFKDDLFVYPKSLATSDNGTHRTIDYNEMRDINDRDAIPERRVKPRYISTGVRRVQQDLSLNKAGAKITHFAIGRQKNARMIVLYLHGQGGSRKQGVDDFTFGGNFNRLKSLMAENDGLYLVPDFPDFGENGASQISELIRYYSAASPGAPVFVACGSMGGGICWNLAKDQKIAAHMGGLLLLGSHWDESFLTTPTFKARVPVLFAHGSRDKVFPVVKQEEFFRRIRKTDPAYPVRFMRFESGTHGTPIRMIDWRESLNWMLQLRQSKQ